MKCSSVCVKNIPLKNYSLVQIPLETKKENISFKKRGIKSSPFLDSTCNTLQTFYSDYEKSLAETTLKDISQIVKELVKENGYSKKDILSAMQKLTQFASMRSILDIANVTNKYGVSCIGLYDTLLKQNKPENIYANYTSEITNIFFDKANTNIFMSYLYNIKDLFKPKPTKEIKIAYFLDNSSISNLETLKQENPQFFKDFVKNKNITFFLISSWDTGINFANRTKSLKETTKDLLERCKNNNISIDNAIDSEILHKIKELGISPTIISKDGLATEMCVYRQMAPDKMTKDELFHAIDTVSQEKTILKKGQFIIKDILAKYLQSHFKVYTPERFSLALKKLHSDILDYAKKINISPNDIIYLQSETVKSYIMTGYMYKVINNIPDEQFVRIRDLLLNNNIKNNKLVVMLDDCTLSGQSLKTFSSELSSLIDEKVPLVFAFVCGTKKAIDSFPETKRTKLLVCDVVNHVNIQGYHNFLLKKILGKSMFSSRVSTGVIMPQNSPDNNTKITSILYFLHDFMFRKGNAFKTKAYNTPSDKKYIVQVIKTTKNSMELAGESFSSISDEICNKIINSNIFSFLFKSLYGK